MNAAIKSVPPLMQREWLQHRFAWALLMLVPLALAVLPLTLAEIQFDPEMADRAPRELALMLTVISIIGSMAVLGLILWIVSLFITISTPRRDHGDRSIEFWLSLPVPHAPSLAVPVLVHLVLVPAAALLVGALSGLVVSMLMVGRYAGLSEWFSLPWGPVLTATLSLLLRLAAGLPLMLLWLLPLLLLAMLANALFRRWGLPVLGVAIGLGGYLAERVFGVPVVFDVLGQLLLSAGQSLAGASGEGMAIDPGRAPVEALSLAPRWVGADLLAALRALISPLFAGGLLVSAGLFYALVQWRARGAGGQG
jgi:ABC-2 type transport system permease protein